MYDGDWVDCDGDDLEENDDEGGVDHYYQRRQSFLREQSDGQQVGCDGMKDVPLPVHDDCGGCEGELLEVNGDALRDDNAVLSCDLLGHQIDRIHACQPCSGRLPDDHSRPYMKMTL